MARQRRGIWSLRFAWKAILSQFGVHYPFGRTFYRSSGKLFLANRSCGPSPRKQLATLQRVAQSSSSCGFGVR
ncbi:hypothetical protein MPL3365_140252 [Mesorhizobium plurifarium]|uniref:Uncharacterized protein n=1 Tax=Mesorhizobium plurifarium TaxID=69974 RepID=A0A090FXV3_MESPL|nr:hypothetical protein MPL3365_140252 [Mesorhizobium plurifarium]